eukprot:m.13295 g.13295  ORF g.13295 m.13295 type:complete len:527 (+) comp24639_c0_seq1:571-2151(+)
MLHLPKLPLDRPPPDYVLRQRRGAISFGSDRNRTYACAESRRSEVRRGAISWEAADAQATYVRRLGDLSSTVRMICHKSDPRTKRFFRRRSTTIQLFELEKMISTMNGGSLNVTCDCRICSKCKRIPIQYQLTNGENFGRPQPHRLTLRNRARKTNLPFLSLEDNYAAKIKGTLAHVNDWSFDVFALHQATSGRTLFNLSMNLFQNHGLVEAFNLDYMKLMKFLDLVEQDYYCGNPYHNGIHAADVTQATHCFLSDSKMRSRFSKLEVLAMLLAGITHDVGHPGVNQEFLISTSSHLASIHGKKSVLERHHCRTAKAMLIKCQLLSHLPASEKEQVLNIMESCILATDMSQHKDYMTRFEALVLPGNRVDMADPEHRTLVRQVLLKCADVSNPCRPWRVSQMWSHRIMEEFYRQGDFEKGLGLNVSFLCDRTTTSVPKAQSGFIEFVVDPMFTLWDRFVGSPLTKSLCRNLDNNKVMWDDIASQLDDESAASTDSELEEPAMSPMLPVVLDLDVCSDVCSDDSIDC